MGPKLRRSDLDTRPRCCFLPSARLQVPAGDVTSWGLSLSRFKQTQNSEREPGQLPSRLSFGREGHNMGADRLVLASRESSTIGRLSRLLLAPRSEKVNGQRLATRSRAWSLGGRLSPLRLPGGGGWMDSGQWRPEQSPPGSESKSRPGPWVVLSLGAT